MANGCWLYQIYDDWKMGRFYRKADEARTRFWNQWRDGTHPLHPNNDPKRWGSQKAGQKGDS